MQEDDENVELWYLTAVALNSLQPPDYESARCVCAIHVLAKSCIFVDFAGWRAYATCRCLLPTYFVAAFYLWGGPSVAAMYPRLNEVEGNAAESTPGAKRGLTTFGVYLMQRCVVSFSGRPLGFGFVDLPETHLRSFVAHIQRKHFSCCVFPTH